MRRKRQNYFAKNSDETEWANNFESTKNYQYPSSFDTLNNEPTSSLTDTSLNYDNNFLWNNGPQSQLNFHGYNQIRITNVMPLLVSMTLLGLREFSAQNNGQTISQGLQPPRIINNNNIGTTYKAASSSSLSPDILNSMRSGRYNDGSPSITGNNDGPTGSGQNDINAPSRYYEAPQDYIGDEASPGPAMELVYAWKKVDFEFESAAARERAIFEENYIPENNLPLGLEIWHDRIFLTLPKWKTGIPATLTTVPRYSKTKSPKLRPYPSWGWHHQGSCGGMTSVFRVQVDQCDRLWVLDSGTINLANDSQRICPPAIFIFDLRTDRLIKRYQIPEKQVKEDSLWANIVVDIRNDNCSTAKAYISDVWRFAMIIYDLAKDTSFRIQHHFFLPDPLSSRYELHGLQFQWMDGILGMALSPIDIDNERTLFFHPMSSFREFAVSTAIFSDKQTADTSPESFVPIGKPRAKDYGHSSGSAIDNNGVMFFNMVTRDSVWCWDTRKEYIPQNLGLIGVSNKSLIFPNDLRVDHAEKQSFWTISNRLPMYLYGPWNSNDVNFRVYRAYVGDAVKNTVCDPDYIVPVSDNGFDETC